MDDIFTAPRQNPSGKFLYGGQEPVQQPQQPEPAQSSNSTALTSAPRGSVPEEDDDEDNSDTTNTVLIAGVLAGTGALILGIGALMTWTCLRRKKTEQTNSKAMDENQSRDHRSNSHHENGAPSLSSYEPTGHASTMHTDSQMKNSAVRSDSQHSRHVSMHQATGYGHSHTHSSGSVSTLQQDSQTTGVGGRLFDTLDDHTFPSAISERPQKNAAAYQWQQYLESQLDSLIGKVVLQSVVILGGPASRLYGGQAIIQLADDRVTRDQLALKFILAEGASSQEKSLYMDKSNPLGKFLPQLFVIAEGESAILDGEGSPLPPCIVMEKGESLDTWTQGSSFKLDMFTGLQILSHVSARLMDLHAAGYVHRDLKPGNVMWLPRPGKKRWTLIDFGCVAKLGEFSRTGFSLFYAAPEAISAYKAGEKGIIATEALDAWSLGIMAIEMFTGQQPLDVMQEQSVTMDMILGNVSAPWEDPETAPAIRKKLGNLQKSILGLLDRDAHKRLSVTDFHSACRRMISNTTIGSDAQTFPLVPWG